MLDDGFAQAMEHLAGEGATMDADELKELEDPSTWEDGGEVRPAVKSSRAVVSVAFSREDLARIAAEAERRGMKTSEFIRAAALRCVTTPGTLARVVSVTGLADSDYPTNRTRAPQGKWTQTPKGRQS
jgi:hypothetical protein